MTDVTAPAKPKTFAEAEDVLAASLPNYEARPQQQALAAFIEGAIADGRHGLAEAGCGTGKSLGYLIPAILSGDRVVVSTATKALQDQVATKDLPFLAEHLPEPFTFALLKGRSNYACLAKAATATIPASAHVNSVLAAHVSDTGREEGPLFLGERDQLGVTLSDGDWRQVTATGEECPGKRDCPFGKTCYAERAKERARASQIVVVNHALYLTDLSIKVKSQGLASMIGEHDVVIFDEAHELEEYATGALSARLSEASVTQIVGRVRRLAEQALPVGSLLGLIEADAEEAVAAAADLFPNLEDGRLRSGNLLAQADAWLRIVNALTNLNEAFGGPAFLDNVTPEAYEDSSKAYAIVSTSLDHLVGKFRDIVLADFSDLVRWIEVEEVRATRINPVAGTRKVVRSAPIHVGPFLSKHLWEGEEEITAILTSATLETEFIAERLGLKEYAPFNAGTPFDFTTQAALYIPRNLPAPTADNKAAWSSLAVSEIHDLLLASGGRALLLFTSRAQLNLTHDHLFGRLPYTFLKQGDAPNPELAKRFAEDETSVLFATRSFFTGVDFQGSACSLVVVDKLPFGVPTEPIIEARCEQIRANGGSDFSDFTIPTMSLVLRQGFGRLIRHRNDRGVVAILDPRLDSKGYGRQIVRNLPPAQRVGSVAEVKAFLDQ